MSSMSYIRTVWLKSFMALTLIVAIVQGVIATHVICMCKMCVKFRKKAEKKNPVQTEDLLAPHIEGCISC